MEEIVNVGEYWEKSRERIGFISVGVGQSVIQEGYAKVEIRKRLGSQGFEKNVDDHIWVI